MFSQLPAVLWILVSPWSKSCPGRAVERLRLFCKCHLDIGGLDWAGGAVKNEFPVKCEVVGRWPLAAGGTAAGGLVEASVNF